MHNRLDLTNCNPALRDKKLNLELASNNNEDLAKQGLTLFLDLVKFAAKST